MAAANGPFLVSAVFCERALVEKDGVLSLIRIVDRIEQTAVGAGVPESMPPLPITLAAILSFKAGHARGRHTVTFRPEAPSGLPLAPLQFPVLFEGEDRGVNLVLNLSFEARHEGLYWFDVLLDDALVTRMPLRVIYLPTRNAAAS